MKTWAENIAKILKSQETDRPWTHWTEQYVSEDECTKWNKQRKYIHSRFQGLKEDQKNSISKFIQLEKPADKVT